MKIADIPNAPGFVRATFDLADLIERASSHSRSSWVDLPSDRGIYVVYWTSKVQPIFKRTTGKAKYAAAIDPVFLRRRWKSINQNLVTDIIYVGKANSVRRRVRVLARFGVGKSDQHKGGEWMWQLSTIAPAKLLVQTCPRGRQVPFENALLEKFYKQHGDLPIANRDGPEGPDRWWPG